MLAIVLTLCIGSFALASTGTGDNYSLTPATASSTTALTQAAVTQAAVTSSSSTTSLPALQLPTVDTAPAAAVAAASAADLQLQQAKENAILDLIGEKMTADDKTTFDQLRAIAAQEQVAVSQAQAALQTTKAQITALIDKYLGVSNGISVDLVTGSDTSVARTNSIPEK